MTLKRGNDCDDGSDYKRLRYDNDAQTWPSCASVSELADLDLTEELAVQQVDSFLKRVGVCAGIHAASDAQCDAANRRQGMFAMHEEWQGLTEHTWRCCAELNVLLKWYSSQLETLTLAGQQSWPRASKARACDQMTRECCQSRQPTAWMQEHIIAHLLQSILTNQVDLAVSKSVIDLRRSCPAWLQSWCLRWGFTGQHISILTLMAYAESESSSILYDFLGHPLEPSKPTSTANMVLYLPCTLDEIES